jgi:hypothetical protein
MVNRAARARALSSSRSMLSSSSRSGRSPSGEGLGPNQRFQAKSLKFHRLGLVTSCHIRTPSFRGHLNLCPGQPWCVSTKLRRKIVTAARTGHRLLLSRRETADLFCGRTLPRVQAVFTFSIARNDCRRSPVPPRPGRAPAAPPRGPTVATFEIRRTGRAGRSSWSPRPAY